MPRLRNSVAIGAVAVVIAAGIGIPALGQQQKPESLLPPGFGQPAPSPSPASSPSPSAARPAAPRPQAVAPAPVAGQPAPGATTDNPLGLSILPGAAPTPSPSPTPTPTPTGTPSPTYVSMPAQYELPAFARRPINQVGIIGRNAHALPADAFGNADGRYLETLMRRLDTPIASRWMEIFLRRALASQVETPPNVNGADFAAERAWLLLRMGESAVARSLVQHVDRQDYTAKLLQVAMQTALANGDPAQICSLTGLRGGTPVEAAWVLAKPICAGLAGYPQQADTLMKDARRHRVATGVDLHLAEKVMGAGMRGDQAVTIEWTGVTQLNAWRYGLAMATGVAIPDELLKTVGRQVAYWQALSPMLDPRARAVFADRAAARGILSTAAMVDLYGAIDMGDNAGTPEDDTARNLRTAYVGADRDGRLSAMRGLWQAPDTEQGRYARMVLTAQAAALIPPADKTSDVDTLIASMLSAGYDRAAMRWEGHVENGSEAAALLALADPAPSGPASYGVFDAFRGKDTSPGKIKSRMLAAGLAGLARLSPNNAERAAKEVNVRIGAENAWTRALDRAVRAQQPGTVVLLAAVGMQSPDWAAVSPGAVFRIVAALNAVGLTGDARMIAAEAVARA
ncbi:MAG: hypothetical protein ACTHMG_09525 [Sphingomonas sp.]